MRWWLLAVGASGCAFGRAMREGDGLAAAGDWAAAFERYSAAVEQKPDDPEAAQARQDASERAVQAALTAADAALAAGEYEAARRHADDATAIDPDHPDVFELLRALEADMVARTEALWQAQDPVGAYAFAVRTKAILPKSPQVQAAVDRARQVFLVEASARVAANEHARAVEILQIVTQHEPDRKAEVAAIEGAVRTAWADHLVATAKELAAAKRIGPAAVALARAYEVAGREPDLAQAKTLARSLTDRGRFSILLDVTGEPSRVGPVRDAVAAGLATVPDAVVVPSGEVALGLRLTLKPHRCTEADTVTREALDYVSGQVEKPNPVWVELADRFTAARDRMTDAQARSEKVWPEVAAADVEYRKAAAGAARLEQLLGEIGQAGADAGKQLAAAQQRHDGLVAELDALIAGGTANAGTVSAYEAKIAEAARISGQWSAKVDETVRAEEMAQQKLAEIVRQRDAAQGTLGTAQAEYDGIIAERNAAHTELTDLNGTLSQTTKSAWEEVHATLNLDVHDWKRTCVAPVAVGVRAGWRTTLGTARTLEPNASITDRAWTGNAKARLAADPKSYPTADPALVALADAEMVKALLTWVTTLADEAYRDWIASTLTAMRDAPLDAATGVLRLRLGAPGRIDEATAAAFDRYLKEQCGLEKPELITAP